VGRGGGRGRLRQCEGVEGGGRGVALLALLFGINIRARGEDLKVLWIRRDHLRVEGRALRSNQRLRERHVHRVMSRGKGKRNLTLESEIRQKIRRSSR